MAEHGYTFILYKNNYYSQRIHAVIELPDSILSIWLNHSWKQGEGLLLSSKMMAPAVRQPWDLYPLIIIALTNGANRFGWDFPLAAHIDLTASKVVIIKDEGESVVGKKSGSMVINRRPQSHLGPINCCPCHLLGSLYCQYLQLQNSPCLRCLYKIKATRPALRYGLMGNNWLVSLDWMSGVAASPFLLLICGCREEPHSSTDIIDRGAFRATFMYLLERPFCVLWFFFSFTLYGSEMQWDPFYRVKCHRLNLTPLPCSGAASLLIRVYRDVAAMGHKGAAY